AAASPAVRDRFRTEAMYHLVFVEIDAGRHADARALLAEAAEMVGPTGAPALWVANTVARLEVLDGHVAEGLDVLRGVADRIRAAGQEDNSISVYRDIALYAMRALDVRAARGGIVEGLRYAESVEQTACGHSLTSCDALVSWSEGAWDAAVRQGG